MDIVELLQKRDLLLDDETYEEYSKNSLVKRLFVVIDAQQYSPKEEAAILLDLVKEIGITIADYIMFDYLKGEINIDTQFENIIQTYAYVNNRLIRLNIKALKDLGI